MGAGLGLTYQYNQNVSAEVAYGWKVNSDDQVADRKNGELHFRVMARF
jgi:hemolysin activation/secretion protein